MLHEIGGVHRKGLIQKTRTVLKGPNISAQGIALGFDKKNTHGPERAEQISPINVSGCDDNTGMRGPFRAV
jgi:hypothetical protein